MTNQLFTTILLLIITIVAFSFTIGRIAKSYSLFVKTLFALILGFCLAVSYYFYSNNYSKVVEFGNELKIEMLTTFQNTQVNCEPDVSQVKSYHKAEMNDGKENISIYNNTAIAKTYISFRLETNKGSPYTLINDS